MTISVNSKCHVWMKYMFMESYTKCIIYIFHEFPRINKRKRWKNFYVQQFSLKYINCIAKLKHRINLSSSRYSQRIELFTQYVSLISTQMFASLNSASYTSAVMQYLISRSNAKGERVKKLTNNNDIKAAVSWQFHRISSTIFNIIK